MKNRMFLDLAILAIICVAALSLYKAGTAIIEKEIEKIEVLTSFDFDRIATSNSAFSSF